jgi:hypothetical protein
LGRSPSGPIDRRLVGVLSLLGMVVALWTAVGVPAEATYSARTSADEPQYLLTALSLGEDGSLDIADELRDERWRDFHAGRLPRQTEPRDDGSELSPHDPLLPLVLAVPMRLGGWKAAKGVLAVVAGLLAAAMAWVAIRRFAAAPAVAVAVVGAFAVGAPLTAYGVQVYPELPAALAVTLAVAALAGPFDRRGRWLLVAAVVVLPWLAIKYVPVAAALAGVALVQLWRRGDRRPATLTAVVLVVAGGLNLAFHQAVYGGWTVYAAGDHFVTGEFSVVGTTPDYGGRTVRLVGLLVDGEFGLVAWAPVFLLVVPALAGLVRRRPPGWVALVVPLAAGWANAAVVALTMHGWWWPGRQVVVVVPAMVLAAAWWVDQLRGRVGWSIRPVIALGAVGALFWGWLLVDVLGERRRLIIDFTSTTNPLARAWQQVLPDYRTPTAATWTLHAVWLVVLTGLAVVGWRWTASMAAGPPPSSSTESTDQGEPIHVHI